MHSPMARTESSHTTSGHNRGSVRHAHDRGRQRGWSVPAADQDKRRPEIGGSKGLLFAYSVAPGSGLHQVLLGLPQRVCLGLSFFQVPIEKLHEKTGGLVIDL